MSIEMPIEMHGSMLELAAVSASAPRRARHPPLRPPRRQLARHHRVCPRPLSRLPRVSLRPQPLYHSLLPVSIPTRTPAPVPISAPTSTPAPPPLAMSFSMSVMGVVVTDAKPDLPVPPPPLVSRVFSHLPQPRQTPPHRVHRVPLLPRPSLHPLLALPLPLVLPPIRLGHPVRG
ncbi:hypothetical protein Dda_8797 [Drechslerella dactyloides]|uniref:Uncharacterized protein n=1 Tax=Drechslerella dactyloides TaxID=74499 RepID=A0AAD6NFK9_DREDA|nr:hypothetical protein Dda_8797 [Drechslerella dactyloides]